MKIVKIIGGLGNQMFQYALYLSLKNKYPGERILLDIHYFDSYKLHNGYELEKVFNIKADYASKEDIQKVTRYCNNYMLQKIQRRMLPAKNTECIENEDFSYQADVYRTTDCYYEGYWQNSLYFDNIKSLLISELLFDTAGFSTLNKQLIEEIKRTNSISIHIRRGDYVNHKQFGGICEVEYYKKAIQYLLDRIENPSFYLFSNDKEWIVANIIPSLEKNDYEIVDLNKGYDNYIDMYLMSICRNNIIANSTFSWWAAYLNMNSEAIIIAPAKWTRQVVNPTIQLASWILI